MPQGAFSYPSFWHYFQFRCAFGTSFHFDSAPGLQGRRRYTSIQRAAIGTAPQVAGGVETLSKDALRSLEPSFSRAAARCTLHVPSQPRLLLIFALTCVPADRFSKVTFCRSFRFTTRASVLEYSPCRARTAQSHPRVAPGILTCSPRAWQGLQGWRSCAPAGASPVAKRARSAHSSAAAPLRAAGAAMRCAESARLFLIVPCGIRFLCMCGDTTDLKGSPTACSKTDFRKWTVAEVSDRCVRPWLCD